VDRARHLVALCVVPNELRKRGIVEQPDRQNDLQVRHERGLAYDSGVP
jgi:hypothetical protein